MADSGDSLVSSLYVRERKKKSFNQITFQEKHIQGAMERKAVPADKPQGTKVYEVLWISTF